MGKRGTKSWLSAGLLSGLLGIGCASAGDGDLAGCTDARDAATAMEACTRVIDANSTAQPDRALALSYRGGALNASGRAADAIRDLDEAVRLAPTDAMILANRGAIHSIQGHLEAARADIEHALRLDPGNVLALGNRAILHSKAGEFRQAREVIDRAIAIDGSAYQLWAERCWVGAVLADQLETSLSDCNEAIAREARDPNNFNNRGFIYFRMGEYAKSIADYDASIEGNPKVASSFLMRGLAKRAAGIDGAEADIGQGMQLDPGVAARYAGYGVDTD